MLAAAISAGANLAGSALDYFANKSNAKRNIKLQKDFAQQGVQWKVEDARKAGVHPLYALGAQTHSFSPVSTGSDFGTAFANAGQDLSRAMNTTRSADQRLDAYSKTLQDLQVERGTLENEILRTDLASRSMRLAQQSGPPIPSPGPVSASDKKTENLRFFGSDIHRNPYMFSAAEKFTDEYGEPAEYLVAGPALGEAVARHMGLGKVLPLPSAAMWPVVADTVRRYMRR